MELSERETQKVTRMKGECDFSNYGGCTAFNNKAYEDMKRIIFFTFADMKYHDLLEEIKQKEKNKES